MCNVCILSGKEGHKFQVKWIYHGEGAKYYDIIPGSHYCVGQRKIREKSRKKTWPGKVGEFLFACHLKHSWPSNDFLIIVECRKRKRQRKHRLLRWKNSMKLQDSQVCNDIFMLSLVFLSSIWSTKVTSEGCPVFSPRKIVTRGRSSYMHLAFFKIWLHTEAMNFT